MIKNFCILFLLIILGSTYPLSFSKNNNDPEDILSANNKQALEKKMEVYSDKPYVEIINKALRLGVGYIHKFKNDDDIYWHHIFVNGSVSLLTTFHLSIYYHFKVSDSNKREIQNESLTLPNSKFEASIIYQPWYDKILGFGIDYQIYERTRLSKGADKRIGAIISGSINLGEDGLFGSASVKFLFDITSNHQLFNRDIFELEIGLGGWIADTDLLILFAGNLVSNKLENNFDDGYNFKLMFAYTISF